MHLAGLLPETTALRTLLRAAGVEVSEDLALLLAGGAGFAAMGFRYADGFSHFHLSGWNPFQSDVVAGVRRLGLEADVHETGGRAAARRALAERLAADRPVAAWIDGATLYGRGLEGAGERVVVVHREDLIGDLGPDPVPVDPERLAAARGRIRRLRHRLLAVAPGPADLAAGLRAGLERCVAGPSGAPRGAARNFSLDGLARQASHPSGEMLAAMRRVVPAQDGLLRGMQARGLREAAAVLALPGLGAVAERTHDLAAAWLAAAERADGAALRDLHAEELAVRDALRAALRA